jgi:hypothetical protein
MGYFSKDICTESDLKREYFRLAKLYHSDTGGDDQQFLNLTNEYAKLKAKLADGLGDIHRRAKVLSAAVQEVLEPMEKVKAYILLRMNGIDVTIARQCKMKKFLQAFDAIEALKREMNADITVYVGNAVKDEITTLYPCTRENDWIYMGKGKRPVNVKDPIEEEKYKNIYMYANGKYTWAFSIRDRKCYMMEGSMQELKAML